LKPKWEIYFEISFQKPFIIACHEKLLRNFDLMVEIKEDFIFGVTIHESQNNLTKVRLVTNFE
jgi:hypothetical protein